MNKIGLLFGMEESFPPALVEEINGRHARMAAEFVKIGAVTLLSRFMCVVVFNRITQDVPRYSAKLKLVALIAFAEPRSISTNY